VGEVENLLGIGVYPITWPIFRGGTFRGVWHRVRQRVYLFDKDYANSSSTTGSERPPVEVTGIDDPAVKEALDERGYQQLCHDAELLELAGDGFDAAKFEAGQLSPMFFGSAVNNFGLEAFLETFCDLMPPPRARATDAGPVEPTRPEFSGFVFKIQANMDKAHRDRMAFLRICSGKLVKGMKVHNVRTGKELRLANPTQFLARERSTVEESYAGDVVGLHDTGTLEIGDTLTEGSRFSYEAIPSFAPEHFRRLALVDPLKRKQFARGIEQLAQEGTVQLYRPPAGRTGELVLGALGQLQFEVVKYRLEAEYGVEVRVEAVPWQLARWVSRADGTPLDLEALHDAVEGMVVLDVRGREVVLFDREWALRTAEKLHPEYLYAETAHGVVVRAA
jgi:peptide chain release factor 3